MNEAVAFMGRFIEFECLTAKLIYTEESDEVVEAKLDELAEFYALGARPDVYRMPKNDREYFIKGREFAKSVSPRVLFQIKQYDHPVYGEIYRCYVSHYLRPGNTAVYNANLYVLHSNNNLRIISKYTICTACQGTDRVDGEVCPECELDGWNHSNGVEFEELGMQKGVLKIRPPDDPVQRTEYERD